MKNRTWLVSIVWIAGVLLVWETAAYIVTDLLKDPLAGSKLPYPHAVAATIATNGELLGTAMALTGSQALLGFAIGTIVGYLLAIVMSMSKTMERIAYPYLIVSQMIPILGLAPIIFNIVRDMNLSRIVIASYITFFPVAVNTLSGFRSVDVEKRQLMFSYAASTRTSYFKLMIPFSVPYLFAGLKIAGPLSITASILVDMLGSKDGIGVKLLYSLYGGAMDIFWASVILSASMGIASYLLVVLAEFLFVPWQRVHTARAGQV